MRKIDFEKRRNNFRTPRTLGVMIIVVLLLCLGNVVASAQPVAKVKVLIAFSHQPGPVEQALVRSHGGEIRYTYHLVPAMAVSLPEVAIDALLRNPNIIAIEPDLEVQVVDAELDAVWGVKRIGAGAVHAAGNKGAGVKVGILDTGIDTDHPDLSYDPTCSASFVASEPTIEDGHSHGTHTAGTVAALDNDTGVVGVAPEVTLCIYKVFNSSGSGSYSDIIAALERAVTDGVQITNNSYGSPISPGLTVKEAFDNAYTAGILHLAAAGNYGNSDGTGENCIYPGRWASVMATAATTLSDTRASFSSTCPEVEIAAPGNGIYSTMPGGGYGYKSGTSMASPHAAGTAALVLAANPDWSNEQVRARLQATADDLGIAGRDPWYGFGLVDAVEAAGGLPPNTPPVADNQSVTTAEDTSVGITLTASDVDGDPLTYSVVSGPSHGTLSGTPPSLTYMPGSNFNGLDSFTFRASDGLADSNVANVSITVTPVNDTPAAAFTYTCADLTCNFDASASYDPDGTIAGYSWNFGDGQAGSGATTSHSYATAGSYQVTLTVADNGSATDTDMQAITVSSAFALMHAGDLDGSLASTNKKFWWAEVVVVIHDQGEGLVAGATVQGTWSGGASGSGSCLTAADGTCTILSPKIPLAQQTVTFTLDDVVQASMTYDPAANHDPDGDSAGASILVSQSGNQPPLASFTYTCTDLACSFDASGSSDPDGAITSYGWDFGDGNTASGLTASHSYSAAGTYTVRLTVTDNAGASGTDSQNVLLGVSPGTMFVFEIAISGKAAGPNRSATVVVTIHDTLRNPVAGATVYGTWDGDISASASGITAADGSVTLISEKTRLPDAVFTFTVENVLHASLTYDPELNVLSSASIVVP